MALEQTSKFCPTCGGVVLAQRAPINHLLHFLLSLFSCVWVLLWLPLAVLHFGGWRCSRCGRKV